VLVLDGSSVEDEAQARQLLEGHRLADVAESLGHQSTSTFVRAFRRWTGETPAAWRATR
jgi:AraC-like DNA-binding protein